MNFRSKQTRDWALPRVLLLVSTVFALSGHALADDNPSTATAPAQSRSGAAAGTGSAEEGQLEEIVVTAEKHSENVQHAPVAITALDGATLADTGMINIRGVQTIITNANFERQNDYTQLYIRGIGQNQDSDYIDSGTAIYFNDMYASRAFAASIGFYDVSNVQILPGPQGTLYGRNAMGGAILVAANRPTNEYQTSAEFEAGNYNSVHVIGVENVPLDDSLAVRFAVESDRHEGYLSNGADDLAATSARVGALYKLNDSFSAYGWVSYYYNNGTSEDAVPYPFNHSNPNFVNNAWYVVPGGPLSPTNPGASVQNAQATGLELTYNFANMTLTAISTLFDYHSDNHTWILFFPLEEINSEYQFTQELRLSSDRMGPFSWVAGLYYLDFDPYQSQFGTEEHTNDTSYAGYGNLTYHFSDRLRLTGGLRYSDDKKQGYGVNAQSQAFNFNHAWDHTDWKVGVDTDLTATSLLYASVQTGYEEGTYATVPNTPTFSNLIQPETLLAYTIGSKNRFFNNRLEVNDEAFYYKVTDLQLTQLTPVNGITLVASSDLKIFGNELSVTTLVTDEDQLVAKIGYLHSRYENLQGLVGQQSIFAPDWTISAGYQHNWLLNSGAHLTGRVDTHYSDSFWGSFGHIPDTQQSAYTKTDLSLTYYSASDKWNLGLWVKNIENAAVWNSGGPFGPYVFAFPQAPRTFGGRFRVGF
jgi:iron complex outermembrane receptor protein